MTHTTLCAMSLNGCRPWVYLIELVRVGSALRHDDQGGSLSSTSHCSDPEACIFMALDPF